MSQRPPRRKNNARHHTSNSQSHSQPIQIQASDYESEAYVPASTEQRTNEQINFTVLQRYVPNLQAIISIAPSTQLYTFSPENEQWDKTNTEGTLFVCELAPSPLTGLVEHCVVVLNRKGMENLIIETKGIENVEAVEPFLLITLQSLGELKTLGLFIYDDQTGAKSYTWKLITQLWEQAMQQREQENAFVEQMGFAGTQGEEMVKSMSMGGQRGMGRRLSMTELFGQRR